MIEPGAGALGPPGVIPPVTPLQFALREQARLRQAIRQALEFSERVHAAIAKNADPRRFLAQEQVRLAKSIRQSVEFWRRVATPADERPRTRAVARRGRVDLLA
jgi:hypothetical protein